MKAKERAVVLIEMAENHTRALENGLNRRFPHEQLLKITERIFATLDELQDLVEVEDDPFQTRTGFLQ